MQQSMGLPKSQSYLAAWVIDDIFRHSSVHWRLISAHFWQWVSFILAHSVAHASQIVAQVVHNCAENSLFLDIYWDDKEQIS